MSTKDKVSCGLDVNFTEDLEEALTHSKKFGYDFICSNLVREGSGHFQNARLKDKIGGVTGTDFLFNAQKWGSKVVGRLSCSPDLASGIANKRLIAVENMKKELRFAAFLGLPAVAIELTKENCSNVARIVYSFLQGHSGLHIWVKIPLQSSVCKEDTWQWWNKFRTLCNHHDQIGVALELTPELPSQLERWSAEPIRAMLIPRSRLKADKSGRLGLSSAHQDFVTQMFKLSCRVLISGEGLAADSNAAACNEYLNQLFLSSKDDERPELPTEYQDDAIAPIQPLRDNLASSIYEMFEKDPVKYAKYEEAIVRCLIDRVPDSEANKRTTIIMVLGAGRGPLVRKSLIAAKKTNRKVRVYAVEKNTNACVFLEHLKSTLWKDDDVTVVSADMRTWEAPELADIVVSELLGCFGDDELSPECLDGANRFLKPDAVSIPQSYTSYLSPVSSHELYNKIAASSMISRNKPAEVAFEEPYNIGIFNYHELVEPVPLFTFNHPNWHLDSENPKPDFYHDVSPQTWDLKFSQKQSESGKKANANKKSNEEDSLSLPANSHNTRYLQSTFDVPFNTTVHGFAGYFRCALYKDVEVSIEPKTESRGMPSWVPMFFPLHYPLPITKGSTIKVDFWRCSDETKVWYEWCVVSPQVSEIHNPKGRSNNMGL